MEEHLFVYCIEEGRIGDVTHSDAIVFCVDVIQSIVLFAEDSDLRRNVFNEWLTIYS